MEHEAIQQQIAAHYEREETSSARMTLWKLRAARAGRILCRAAIVLSLLHYLWVLYRHPGQNGGGGAVSAAVNRRAVEPVPQAPLRDTPEAAKIGPVDTPAPAPVAKPRELGFEPFGPLHVILPKSSIADPLSVLDLELLTDGDCAANHAAIENKDWLKLRRVISTKLKPASLEWFPAGGDAVTILQRFEPEGGVKALQEVFAVTKTMLSESRTVRESAGRPLQSRSGTAPLLVPVKRDGENIYCTDLGGTLALDTPPEPLVALPPVTDMSTLIDAEMRRHLNPKPLSEAQPGDFVELPLYAEVESVSENGTVKGAVPADKNRTEELPVEIRSAAGRRAGAAVTAGRRLRYDASCSLQVVSKNPLVLIDRTVR